jgi:hypothetical protein
MGSLARRRWRLALRRQAIDTIGREHQIEVLAGAEDGGGEADQPTLAVEEAAATRTGRDRCAGEQSLVAVVLADQQAAARRETETKRIADCQHALADLQRVAAAQSDGLGLKPVDGEQADVALAVDPCPTADQCLRAGFDANLRRVADDVAIGRHLFRADDDAAALSQFAALIVDGAHADHSRRDHGEELLRRQIRSRGGTEQAGAGGSD